MLKENSGISPIVKERTRTESQSVHSVIYRLDSGEIVIPDYQRDAEQWDHRKESLFIESLLNNLTTPALFFSENHETGCTEVVDGQQRLSTIQKYAKDRLSLSADRAINYLSPQSVHYSGKTFSELPPEFKRVFEGYPLTIIYLPPRMDLSTKLEIFRRINEGGTPLTAQDIRLAYYSGSKCVHFIRLAGLYAETPAAERMQQAAAEKGVANPWEQYPETWKIWKEWWEDKGLAKGQTPSAMILWYLVFRHREQLDRLISSPNSMKHLAITFHGSTEEALDIYCAQLQYTETKGGTSVSPAYGNGIESEFHSFVQWIDVILRRSLPGVSVDKYKQMALLIGAAVELQLEPNQLGYDAWDAIREFIRAPRRAGEKRLAKERGYPESRGRWKGERGQKAQCDMAKLLLSRIVDAYP